MASRLTRIRLSPDKPTFSDENGKPYVPFGVNYYRPGTGWAPQVWKQFDPEATRRDFARLRELGGNCVRVFLSYGSFYQEAGKLTQDGVEKFDRFLELAEEAGLYVHPTGPDHWEGLPEWARVDRIADKSVLQALETFWTLFARRYRGNPAIFAYDLLNEPTVGWDSEAVRRRWNHRLHAQNGEKDVPIPEAADRPNDPTLLDFQRCREDAADEWTRRQVAAIKAADPNALVTVGAIQWAIPACLPGVKHYAGFRPERQSPYLDFLEIHFYPLNHGAYEYRNLEETERNLAYLESVVREVAKPGKPVVVAEYGWYGGGALKRNGGESAHATEEQQAEWCSALVESTAGMACGWLNWGFHDQPEARDVSQLTGLLTADGKEKAWGRRFRELAGKYAGTEIRPGTLPSRPELDWDLCMTSSNAGNAFREAYYQAWKVGRNE